MPREPMLIVEGKVWPVDVADLAPGQPVEIQFTVFKSRATPLVAGSR